MTDLDLLLHLPLDEIHGTALYDTTDARRNGVVHAAATLTDPEFGLCLELTGNRDCYVELPVLGDVAAASEALTLMMWIKPLAVEKNLCLLQMPDPFAGPDRIWAFSLKRLADGELMLLAFDGVTAKGSGISDSIYDVRIKTRDFEWMHVAWVRARNGDVRAYLNGISASDLQSQRSNFEWQSAAPDGSVASKQPGMLARSTPISEQIGDAFVGRMAQFRVYKRALSAEEINWDMEADRPVAYRYRITHPLDFVLENRDADPTLFMDDHPDGQKMYLRVQNVSSAELHLVPLLSDVPSADNCHFELTFRPGAIAPGELAKITLEGNPPDWKVGYKTWTSPTDGDSLYFLCTKPGPIPKAGLILGLEHVQADFRYGTRSTLVDFGYRNLQSGGGETVAGGTQQNLNLVNHLGRRNIPLHVGFAGSNVLLNNSGRSQTPLRLRVTNVVPDQALFDDARPRPGSGVMRFDANSQFILSFDEAEGTDWALTTPDKLGAIEVRYDKGKVGEQSPMAQRIAGSQQKPWQWLLDLADFQLEPGEYLEIRLDNVSATGAYGHSNLYLDYRNIPGYWDGRFTCVIDKAPFAWVDNRVGIGVTPPSAELDVKGTIKADNLFISRRPPLSPMQLEAGWQIADEQKPQYMVDALGMVHLFGQAFYQLPTNWPEKEEWLRKWQNCLTLPGLCAPGPNRQLRFPNRVQCVIAGSPTPTQIWSLLYLNGDPLRSASLGVSINSVFSQAMLNAMYQVHVFLDGITYPVAG
ncbi:LamG domain-containing protein [Methylomonas rhizoryzae]|uniref:LamG domain-containing protein n=1 Tax=Methylomonas rhizoryzae TaxID=2608981 RepID=UPI0012327D33|nr:LamG domain-containing protein [Methylomonas rhizoryzae]